jgi:hypothetical protein
VAKHKSLYELCYPYTIVWNSWNSRIPPGGLPEKLKSVFFHVCHFSRRALTGVVTLNDQLLENGWNATKVVIFVPTAMRT